jgi:hypothetical protein
MDMMFAKVKSARGYTTAQVFANGHGYDRFYPMKSKSLAGQALMSFIHDAGIPQTLLDNSGENRHSQILGTLVQSTRLTGSL